MSEIIDMATIEDLKLYQQLVDTSAMENSKEILPNAGYQHAAIAMAKLFDKTDHYVKMVLSGFMGPVSSQPNYLSSLKACLNKGIKFQIISLDGFNDKSEAYCMLKEAEAAGKDITMKVGSHYLSTILSSNKHFCVFDDNKFRFETDIEKHVAWFSFNDKSNNAALSNIFDIGFAK